LEYYSKLSKLSPEEREEVIARDAAIRGEAHSRGFNQKFMKEHGLKSEKNSWSISTLIPKVKLTGIL